jgi:hypothetical protein
MMLGKKREEEIINKPISGDAETFAKECVDEFSETLFWQAKTLAYQRRNEMVLREHVEEALRIARREAGEKWRPQLLILGGGVLAGTFIQGAASELLKKQTDISIAAIAVYIVLGVVGMITIFWGFWKQYNL